MILENKRCTPKNYIRFNEKETSFFETSESVYLVAYHYMPEDRGSSAASLPKRESWQVSAERVADLQYSTALLISKCHRWNLFYIIPHSYEQ
jgi:hypothetical protein